MLNSIHLCFSRFLLLLWLPINTAYAENEDVVNLTKDIKGRKKYFSSKRVSDCYYKDGAIYFENEKIIDGFSKDKPYLTTTIIKLDD